MIWTRLDSLSERAADREAVVTPKERLTYRSMLSGSRELADGLITAGCDPVSRVAIFLPNGSGFVQAFFGCIRAGVVAVPLNIGHGSEEIVRVIGHARPRVIVTDAQRAPRIRSILDELGPEVPPALLIPGQGEMPTGSAMAPEEDPDRPALLQYSTGSTGHPKPVIRTVRQLMAEVDHFREAVRPEPGDRVLGVVPLFHAHGLGNAMLAALMNGATLVVLENFNPREVLSVLASERITVFPGVPFMFKLLAEMRHRGAYDLGGLRLCFSAGTPLDPEVSRGFHRRFGRYVRQLYGCTEAGSVTLNLDKEIENTLESVGRPLPSVEVAVFDDSGGVLPSESEGEIGIRSPAMSREYDGMAEATKEAFRYGFFFPGDVGRMDGDGHVYITGRKTFFINVGGNKVDPSEVEKVILRHAGVKEVVVVGIPAPYGGEAVKAIVVTEEAVEPGDIQKGCSGLLADYKIPRVFEFRREIPRSPLGKILRKHLV